MTIEKEIRVLARLLPSKIKEFNKEYSFLYTGIKKEGLPEVTYRDESNNLSLNVTNKLTQYYANKEYKKTNIPLNINDLYNNDTFGGTKLNLSLDEQNKYPSNNPSNNSSNNPTIEKWRNLTVKQIKYFLIKANLPTSGVINVLIDRLLKNNVKYENNVILRTSKLRKTNNKMSNINKTHKEKEVNKRKNTDYNEFELIIALIRLQT